MKKLLVFLSALACILALAGCGMGGTYKIAFTVPAGSMEKFILSEEEISATGNKIRISSNGELGDAEVLLFPVNDTVTAGYIATYVTPGAPAEFDAERGVWFKIGLRVRNETDKDKTVYVTVRGVEVRIA